MAKSMQRVIGLFVLGGCAAAVDRDPLSVKGLVSESVTICGDDGIWNDISSPSSHNQIKGIKWQDIEDIMDDFISDHETLVSQVDVKIAELKKHIAKKKGEATSRTITAEEIKALVKQTVEDSTAFGSTDAAVETACGKPGLTFNGQRPNPMGFDGSVLAIEAIAGKFFDERLAGNDFVESEVSSFTQVCEDYLGFQRTGDDKADDMASYCDELCSELGRTVQVVSNEKSPTRKVDVKKLERELQRAESNRQEKVAKQKECEGAKESINKFRDVLKGLSGEMSAKHVLFQKAEWALADAKQALLSLTQDLEQQAALVEKANQGLTDLGQGEAVAKEEMQVTTAALADAKASLATASDDLNSLMEDMEAVRAAEKFADEVKQRLSLMLMSMDNFAEECVREPVRNIGLSEETKVYEGEFFVREVSQSPATGDVKKALTAFHTYCEGTAKNIFELVKDTVDLSPLCDLQDEEETMQEITKAVQQRKDAVVESIEKVQSWLDPFKGTDVTKTCEIPEYVDEGEPMGLRRVMSLLPGSSSETFYSTYLKKWKKKGEFLELLAKIETAINGLNDKIEKQQNELNKRASETQAAEKGLEIAVAAFQKAAEQAQLEKEDLTAVLEELKKSVENAKQNLEDLERRREEALQAWVEARDALLKMHAEATSSLSENGAALE